MSYKRRFGVLLARLEMELISHVDVNFNFLKAISQAFPKLAYPTHLLYGNTLPFVENSQGNVCITLYTHTHKKKIENQAFHERNRELSLALYFSFYQIIP